VTSCIVSSSALNVNTQIGVFCPFLIELFASFLLRIVGICFYKPLIFSESHKFVPKFVRYFPAGLFRRHSAGVAEKPPCCRGRFLIAMTAEGNAFG
jgi:hypothetical protein